MQYILWRVKRFCWMDGQIGCIILLHKPALRQQPQIVPYGKHCRNYEDRSRWVGFNVSVISTILTKIDIRQYILVNFPNIKVHQKLSRESHRHTTDKHDKANNLFSQVLCKRPSTNGNETTYLVVSYVLFICKRFAATTRKHKEIDRTSLLQALTPPNLVYQ
jgi:hypothetical protein